MKPIWLPFGLKPKEPLADEGPRYADLYERGMAAAVDITLLFMLLEKLFNYLTTRFYQQADTEQLVEAGQAISTATALEHAWAAGLPQLWMLNALLQVVILGAFVVGCQLVWNTTPGKWLLGLSIRRSKDLELPERWRYILRFIAYIPCAFLFFLISFNKKRRGFHDRIAGTVVIHTRPKGWYWVQVKRGYRRLRHGPASATPVE